LYDFHTGETDLALRIATQITDPYPRAWALCATAEVSPDSVIMDARAAATLIAEPEVRLEALGAVVEAALRVGDVATAGELQNTFVENTATLSVSEGQLSCLALAVAVSARLGDRDQARELAHRLSSIADPSDRAYGIGLTLRALVTHGDKDLALEMAQQLESVVVEAHDRTVRIELIGVLALVDKERAREIFERLVNPLLDTSDHAASPMILAEGSDPEDEGARFRCDFARLSIAQVVQVAAVVGDSRRALTATRAISHILERYPEQWDDGVRLILLGAMTRVGESVIAGNLAAKIRGERTRAWAIAETAPESVQRRAAIGSALRIDDWRPDWQPFLSPHGTPPPELQMDLPVVPARALAVSAPEALKAIAEELLQA
jgi:hypothetical protein